MKPEANEAYEIDYLAIVKLKWPIFHLSATIHLDSDSQPTWKIASLLILFSNSYPKFDCQTIFVATTRQTGYYFYQQSACTHHCKESEEIFSPNIHNMHGKFEWKCDKYGIKHLIANRCAICNRMAEVKSGEGCSNYRCCITSLSKALKFLWFLEFILNILFM